MAGPRRLELAETGDWQRATLSSEELRLLTLNRFAEVRPDPERPGWQVRAGNRVGAVVLGRAPGPVLEVRVAPKIPVARLLFLLGYAHSAVQWRGEVIDLPESLDLPSAIAEALVRLTDRALAQGLLQGYRQVDETTTTLRGRVRFNDQLRQHFGAALPVEVSYDDFTPDTNLNRILHSALHRMLAVPGIPQITRLRLNRIRHRFAGVGLLRPGAAVPAWRPDRLNRRYQPALRLAELVLDGTSFDLERRGDEGLVPATGFAVNMATVFERFVEAALGEALVRAGGGRVEGQDTRWSLDDAGAIPLRPDLVWYPAGAPGSGSGRPGLVLDVKYKAEQPAGFPNADLYQLLAYCSALGLSEGHLLYARGNATEREYHLPGTGPAGAGVTVHVHTLDLSLAPDALLGQVSRLAGAILQTAGRQGSATAALAG